MVGYYDTGHQGITMGVERDTVTAGEGKMRLNALDIEHPADLVAYLRASSRIGATESPVIEVLAGGVSNRTVLVQRASGEAWVLKQALEKLRVQVDWFSSPERIHREALGLRWLQQLLPLSSITPFIFEDHEHHILAMSAVPEPHQNWKAMLLAGRVEQAHVEQFARILGILHASWGEHPELAREFDDRTFFESLRLEPYYEYTATQVPPAADFLLNLVRECRAQRSALVHGDYSPKNILVHKNALILLDHEVIHFGDPAFDVGFGLTHLLSKAHHLPPFRSELARAAQLWWATYRSEIDGVPWIDGVEERAVRHTLGCLLGRVAGRSTLEYLDAVERARQREAVVRLMADPPVKIPALIDRFLAEVTQCQ